jgi:hypothetical protein
LQPPAAELDPLAWVRLIQGYHFDRNALRISALNVEWTLFGCDTKDQATWTVFVRGIVFDNFAVLDGLFNLSSRNPA